MIGLLIDWRAGTVDPAAADRFAAALGAGLDKTVTVQTSGGAVIAGVHLEARPQPHWRARAMGRGGWLAFTGFIANPDDLRRALGCGPVDDADLYAAGYARWGDAVDLRAFGEFATILAFPDERRVRIARSPLFAPPLHVWHDHGRAVIASNARAVLAGAGLRAEIDEQKVADSLYLNYADRERGWYKGVSRLDVGMRCWLTPGARRTDRYYDIRHAPTVRLRRDSDYVDTATALLAEGTRSVLAGRSRPAVSLSGGFDSQAVAAFVMAERPDQPLLGLTSVPESGYEVQQNARVFEDERHHVAALAAMYPMLDSRLIDSAGVTLDYRLNEMFLLAGVAPRNVLNFPWLHTLHENARAADCDVLLTGSMGNVGFSFDGDGALPTWLRRGRWLRLIRELAAKHGSLGLAHVVARNAATPLLQPIRAILRHAPSSVPTELWSPIAPEYARTMRVRERASVLTCPPRASSRTQRAAMLAGGAGESGDILQGFVAIHGIPMRDPTAYRPLLEFCMGVPDDQFLRSGCSRWLARRMLGGRIPDIVVKETKRGYQVADASVKLERIRGKLISELNIVSRVPTMNARFDLSRLRAAMDCWAPGTRFPTEQRNMLRLALPRLFATSRFIRFIEDS